MDGEHSSRIRVLLVDDHAAFRHSVALFVGSESDMQLVAEAANGRAAVKKTTARGWGGKVVAPQKP